MRTVLRICLRFFALAFGLGALAVGAQERFAFASTPGLLSKEVRPSHYTLRLSVDPAATQFSGEVHIRLTVRKATDSLRLHDCTDRVHGFARIAQRLGASGGMGGVDDHHHADAVIKRAVHFHIVNPGGVLKPGKEFGLRPAAFH